MEKPFLSPLPPFNNPRILALTQKHLQEWLALRERLQRRLGPAEELVACKQHVTRLQNQV